MACVISLCCDSKLSFVIGDFGWKKKKELVCLDVVSPSCSVVCILFFVRSAFLLFFFLIFLFSRSRHLGL